MHGEAGTYAPSAQRLHMLSPVEFGALHRQAAPRHEHHIRRVGRPGKAP
jgi:hypothetical protein